MRTVLNIIWLILAGLWLFLAYVLAGILLCIPIITIPWAIASFRTANYALWPFGRTIVAKPSAGVGSFLGNVIWVIFAGWWLALAHIVSGIALVLTGGLTRPLMIPGFNWIGNERVFSIPIPLIIMVVTFFARFRPAKPTAGPPRRPANL